MSKSIIKKAMAIILVIALCFLVVPMSSFADEVNSELESELSEVEGESSAEDISDPSGDDATLIGAESEVEGEDISQLESEPEESPTPAPQEKPKYLSSIVFGIDEDAEAAKAIIRSKGYEVYDVDLNRGTKRDFVFMGYTTTTNAKRALTDIRVRDISKQQIANGEGTVTNYGGIGYVGAMMIMGPESSLSTATFGGGLISDNASSGEYDEFFTVASTIGEEIIDLATFGLYGLAKSIINSFWEYESFLAVYCTRDTRAGTPIYADFLYSESDPVAPAGYEPVSKFASGLAADLNNGMVIAKENYMFFRTDVEYTDGPDYVSDVRMFSFYEKSRFERFRKKPDDNIGPHGFIYVDDNLIKDNDVVTELYFGYRTTKNPYRAITDIKILSASGREYEYSDTIGNRPVAAYTATKHELDAFQFKYSFVRVDYAEGSVALYATTSPNAGAPIEPEFYTRETPEENLSDEWSYVTQFLDPAPADLTKYSESTTDRFLYFKRPQQHKDEGKYFSRFGLVVGEQYADAVAKCIELGFDYILDIKVPCRGGFAVKGEIGDFYLCYNRTDQKAQAITGLLVDHNLNPVEVEQDVFEYQPLKERTIGGIKYNLVGMAFPITLRSLSIAHPTRGSITVLTEQPASGANKDTIVLYSTTSPKAGAPITEIGQSEYSIKNGYDEVVMHFPNQNGTLPSNLTQGSKFAESYLMLNREDKVEKPYISSLKVGANSAARGAVLQLVTGEDKVNNYLNYDFNHDTGKDFIYIGYNRTANPDEAITGILATYDKVLQDSIVYQGATYYPASTIDFNKGTGGKDIFLYYTRDSKAGAPITDIGASNYSTLDGFDHAVTTPEGNVLDFTKSTGTDHDSFLFFNRDNSNYLSNVASVFSPPNPWLISGLAVLLLTIAIVVAVVVKRKRK